MTYYILEAALDMLDQGFSVIPIAPDGTKRPTIPWKEFQSRRMTEEEASDNFMDGDGIAVIGGLISGGLEILDIDDAGAINPILKALSEQLPELRGVMPMVRTPKGGAHLYYRCEEVGGNMKLWTSDGRTLSETRGEGGYAITWPSPATVHPSGKPYRLIRGSWDQVPVITPKQRAILIHAAAMSSEPVTAARKRKKPRPVRIDPGLDRAWHDILKDWTPIRIEGTEIYWAKPGKRTHGWSATTGFNGQDILVVFSTEAPIPPGTYNKQRAQEELANYLRKGIDKQAKT